MPFAKRRYKGMSPYRAAWPRITGLSMTLYAYHLRDLEEEKTAEGEMDSSDIPPEFQDEEVEVLDPEDATIMLNLNQNGSSISINLSSFTVEELIYWKSFLDNAYEKALPACKARDRKARYAYRKGIHSYSRVYRQLPEYVVRRRLRSKYGEGIPLRLDDVLDGRTSPEDFPEGTGALRLGLAERGESTGRGQDTGTPSDLPS